MSTFVPIFFAGFFSCAFCQFLFSITHLLIQESLKFRAQRKYYEKKYNNLTH